MSAATCLAGAVRGLADRKGAWRDAREPFSLTLEHPATIRPAAGGAFDRLFAIARAERHDDVTADLAFRILEGEEGLDDPAQPTMGALPDEIGAIRHFGQTDVKSIEGCNLVEIAEGKLRGRIIYDRAGQLP